MITAIHPINSMQCVAPNVDVVSRFQNNVSVLVEVRGEWSREFRRNSRPACALMGRFIRIHLGFLVYFIVV